jgi:hypothetical protein
MNSWSSPQKVIMGEYLTSGVRIKKYCLFWIRRCSHHVLLSCTASSKGPQVANHVDHSYYFALHYSSFLAKCMARDVVRKTQVVLRVCCCKSVQWTWLSSTYWHDESRKKICPLDHYPDMMMIQVSKTCSITRPSISQTTTSLWWCPPHVCTS